MKKVSPVFVFLLILGTTYLFADMQRYLVKSGEVQYKITGNGSMMGIETKLEGESSLYFKDYGSIELTKEKTTQDIMGQKEIEEDITKFENGMVYSVDLEEKVIYKQKIPIDSDDELFQNRDENSLKSIGGKMIGNDKVAGYKCDLWELNGAKICIYKGVPLKTETIVMGTTHTQVATSVKFNISIADDKFALPNYPIKSMSDIRAQRQEEMKQQMENMSPEEKKMMQDMMKNMGGMFGDPGGQD